MYCYVLLCIVVYCCVLLCIVVYCCVLLYIVIYCFVLLCIVVYCCVLLYIVVYYRGLQENDNTEIPENKKNTYYYVLLIKKPSVFATPDLQFIKEILDKPLPFLIAESIEEIVLTYQIEYLQYAIDSYDFLGCGVNKELFNGFMGLINDLVSDSSELIIRPNVLTVEQRTKLAGVWVAQLAFKYLITLFGRIINNNGKCENERQWIGYMGDVIGEAHGRAINFINIRTYCTEIRKCFRSRTARPQVFLENNRYVIICFLFMYFV